ncbi:MAG: beta-galactosidase [Clostridiales bacterium]|nr:beta-galactosidase [Clostridiales bacterium]
MGTCYYPEHWDESLWLSDLRRMKEAGISVIRIGEFAWNKFEPREGEFTFDFFDRFLDLCRQEGMQVIFGTPTATPPAWLTEKYPEVLNAFIDGTLMRHGLRKHHNYTSPKYLELCARVVTQIARHLGRHPAIVGWQIDNELNCECNTFYAESDSVAFRVFLREKYGTLEELNRSWGTVFWNQDYTGWDQVYVPRPTANGSQNPHMELDYIRFVSHSARRFCAMQAEILRQHIGEGVYITTNGLFGHLDNHAMTRESLDVYTYDSYPNFAFPLDQAFNHSALNDRSWSRSLIETRSVCPHFGIMEQQSGSNGWHSRMEGPMPRPGQLTLWSIQSIAHGADFVSYFRWRTCNFSTEMYWHGILNYDNRDNRRLQEVRNVGRLMKQLAPVAGADSKAAFALVRDYDNQWDGEIDMWHRRIQQASEQAVFEASQYTHTPYDMLYLQPETTLGDLTRYPVLIYPHAEILTPERSDLLKAYVEQGGTLIIGCRTGQKDPDGHCVMQPMPGLLAGITGTQVEDFTFCSPAEPPVTAIWNGETLDTPVFNDILTATPGAKVLARYASSFYAGEAALVENPVGKGRVLHLGSAFSVSNLRQLLAYTGVLSPWQDIIHLPEGLELTAREKDGRTFLFLLNYRSEAQSFTLLKSAASLIHGDLPAGQHTLPAYGFEVIEI